MSREQTQTAPHPVRQIKRARRQLLLPPSLAARKPTALLGYKQSCGVEAQAQSTFLIRLSGAVIRKLASGFRVPNSSQPYAGWCDAGFLHLVVSRESITWYFSAFLSGYL